jgi:hypothetical protein
MWKKFLRSFRVKRDTFLDDVAPVLEKVAEQGGELLYAIAIDAVRIAERAGVSGEDKFAEAKKMVQNQLRKQGKIIALSNINLVIELAVVAIKK